MRIKSIFLLVVVFLNQGSFAKAKVELQTFQPIVDVLAITEPNHPNSWEDLSSLNDIVQWNYSGLRGSFEKDGVAKFEPFNEIDIRFSGARTMMFDLEIDTIISDSMVFIGFQETLSAQFERNTLISKIRGECPLDGASESSSIYKIRLPAKEPVYVRAYYEAGDASENSGVLGFHFSLKQKKEWGCDENESLSKNILPEPKSKPSSLVTVCGVKQSKNMLKKLIKNDLKKGKFQHVNLKISVSEVRTLKQERNTYTCMASVELTSRLDNVKNFKMTAQTAYTIMLTDDLEQMFARLDDMNSFHSWVDGKQLK